MISTDEKVFKIWDTQEECWARTDTRTQFSKIGAAKNARNRLMLCTRGSDVTRWKIVEFSLRFETIYD